MITFILYTFLPLRTAYARTFKSGYKTHLFTKYIA